VHDTVNHSAFLTAPLEVILRVAEKWFCKLFRLEKNGSENLIFFFRLDKSGSTNSDFFGDPEKKWVYTIKPPFFRVGEKWFSKLGFFSGCRTTFLLTSKSLVSVQADCISGVQFFHVIPRAAMGGKIANTKVLPGFCETKQGCGTEAVLPAKNPPWRLWVPL
jgi:hypothetical protein